jgi:hypothetical protein
VEADVPYMLVGSFASTIHGAPRTTQDIDLVIDPAPESLSRFLASLDSSTVYVGPAPFEALERRDLQRGRHRLGLEGRSRHP